jgi:putative aminopeptidase FrvX
MDRTTLVGLLKRALVTHSPSGHEQEMVDLVLAELIARAHDVSVDSARNIRVRFSGREAGPPVLVTGHKDEVAMIVKRVEADGRLRVRNVGGPYAYKYGEGPVEILGDRETVEGVFSFGAVHVSKESGPQYEAQHDGKIASWDGWWVETKRSNEDLKRAGVHPGTKVVIHRARKQPQVMGDFISGYALDDKGSIPVLLGLAEELTATQPKRATVLAFTAAEEVGAHGAAWVARELAPELTIAVEVAPVMPEYDVHNTDAPVLLYQDFYALYNEGTTRTLAETAEDLGIAVQYAAVSNYGSDASIAKHLGHSARAAAICFPTENTHGWEIANITAIENVLKVLAAYLTRE